MPFLALALLLHGRCRGAAAPPADAGPGHVNDMDIPQVGRGMSQDEDRTHFSMWCLMASSLLAGNDLTTMSKETLAILTHKEMLAIQQDALVYQARRLSRDGGHEVWARPCTRSVAAKSRSRC